MARLIKPLGILAIIALVGVIFYFRVIGVRPISLDAGEISSVQGKVLYEEEIIDVCKTAGPGWYANLTESEVLEGLKEINKDRFVSGINEVISYKKDGGYGDFYLKMANAKKQQIQDLIDKGSRKTKAERETLERLENEVETGAIFIVVYNDGKIMVVEAGVPFIIVDGVGYRSKTGTVTELIKLAE